MTAYLTPTDACAFDGMKKHQPEPASKMLGAYSTPRRDSVPVVECGKCRGHGGWNLQLDAYGPGKHFRASCNNCTGWGYVPEEQGSHIHEWDGGVAISRCCTRYTCAACNAVSVVDSSD
jgi:hypothetical protein